MAEVPGFQRKQFALAAHIRDPVNNPAPGDIEDRRLGIYRELVFNNLQKLLGSTFPVLRKLHDDERWAQLVRDFMVRHRAHSPYFLEIPREFLAYLETGRSPRADDFPFMLELAHYEWVELALAVTDAQDDVAAIDAAGDLLAGVPVKSVLAWPVSYRFPVHRISLQFVPEEPGEQPTCLVIYRDPDDEMHFRELNAVTARLLNLIETNLIETNDKQESGHQLLSRLAQEIDFDRGALIRHGAGALQELRDDGILLGTKIKNRREKTS